MPRKSTAPSNEVVEEGVENFPENKQIIKAKFNGDIEVNARTLLSSFHPKYHGNDKPGCILVKVRREKTYQDHYLDIYGCLVCGLQHECLRSGWEIGWWQGTNSRKLV